MSKPVPVQHPAVVLRSQYRNLRSLVAVLLVAVAALSATVAVGTIDRDGTTTTSSVASGRSYPTLDDPFQTRTQPTRPESRPDESAIASSISQAGSRSYPTLDDPFQSQVEQPRPLGGPDESKIASAIGSHAESGPTARDRAYEKAISEMSPKELAAAFAIQR
jgi:hypothetical protein